MDDMYTYQKDHINVVEEFDYDTQYEKYNQAFKNWRKSFQNPFAFNFEMNKKESIYVESKGFKVPSLEEAESDVIGKIMNITGIAMLMWIFIENIFSRIMIQLFERLGFNIHANFYNTIRYSGGEKEIVSAIIIISLLQVSIPSLYLRHKLKMPKDVWYMNVMNRPSELIRTIAMALAVSTITCIPNIYSNSTSQIYSYFTNIDADVSAWGQYEFIAYTVYDIIILSLLTEILFHTALFSALRQFGDQFALVVTSVISGLLVQDFLDMPSAILITLIAGAGMLRTGSIYTGFFVRIIFKMYRLAIAVIETNPASDMYLERNFFMFSAFALGVGTVVTMHFTGEKRSYFARYDSEVPVSRRYKSAVKAYPFPAVAFICIIAAILKQVF